MSKLISKRSFLKGFAAAAAGAAAAPLVHAKPGDPLPQKWDREADVVILGYGVSFAVPFLRKRVTWFCMN